MTRSAVHPAAAGALTDRLGEARERTLALVAGLSDAEAEAQHTPLLSPLCWDLAHIAAYEDLWIGHRLGGLRLLRADLARTYDAFETPRAVRGSLPLLGRAEALGYLAAVRERTRAVLADGRPGTEELAELVLRHEHQHNETMIQAMDGAELPWRSGLAATPEEPGPSSGTGLEPLDVPAGPFAMGAGPRGFAFDNERPRHRVELPAFRIARTPITNATFLTFVEGGGYVRREWWSDEGWAWKEEYDITHPDDRRWPAGRHPSAPVVHVSWFEADAFARAHGARLPTEAEWERTATWTQEPTAHNADLRANGPLPPRPGTASDYGALGMLGDVWEWTATELRGYPGFRAHPYREYSEVFFGTGMRVLRGGSWASRPSIATPTFRNWDLPQRRQLFAGFRLAWDAA